jgi:hypothetical protein
MAKLGTNEIRKLALSVINENKGGIRYSVLVRKLLESSPETPINTIHGSVWDLHTRFPKEVAKPARGLFAPADGAVGLPRFEPPPERETIIEGTGEKIRETDFYEPFADYLKNDLDEVTVAVPLGGAGLGKKWGTPDVVGVYKPSIRDMIKFGIEVVSAEIKIDPQQPVVAFGQAIAYRLFSSKTYIGMPGTIGEEDLGRLEALCMLFGVGLVLFDLKPEEPNFSIRVRAQRFFPDMFYVNEFADRMKDSDLSVFERLFG